MKRVVIIGAGPAGLTAGYELIKQSNEYEVIILEESDQIGGISRTVNHNGNRMDIGGHRFFSKDDSVMKWWKDMMPLQGAPSYDDKKLGREMPLEEGGPDPEKVDRVMLYRNRVSRIYFKKKFFDYPIKMNVNTIKNMGLVTTGVAGFSYLFSVVRKLPEDSLENFYINRFGRKLYSMFFEGYTEKLWGRSPKYISADWGAQRVKGLSIVAILKDMVKKLLKINDGEVETSLIEAFIYPKFGPGQLWETTASEIEAKGGKINKNCKVTNFKCNNDGFITAVTYEENGKKKDIDADFVISSMPLKDLVPGFENVPSDIAAIAEGLPYRDFVTVGVLTNKLNLKNTTDFKTLNNITPDTWIYVQDAGMVMGRIQVFNNWSPYMVKDPDNTVWVGLEYFCKEGDEFWNKAPEEWSKFGAEELVKMGILNNASDVIDWHVEKVKKAYPAYFDTYKDIDKLVDWINTHDNLYCVGRNGQHRYNNMDHSMVTSFETVKAILTGEKDKTPIWNVNTEKEYHEEKK